MTESFFLRNVWDKVSRLTLPADATPEQVLAARQFFMSGCAAVLAAARIVIKDPSRKARERWAADLIAECEGVRAEDNRK